MTKRRGTEFAVRNPKHIATSTVLDILIQIHGGPLLLHNKKSIQLGTRHGSDTQGSVKGKGMPTCPRRAPSGPSSPGFGAEPSGLSAPMQELPTPTHTSQPEGLCP